MNIVFFLLAAVTIVGALAAVLLRNTVHCALALTVAELDLSIAEVASLCAIIAGWMVQGGQHPALAVLAALAAGAALGAFNGFGVTVLHVPSLIVTLGTAAIARGVAFMITQGVAFVGRWPTGFTGLARGGLLGVPNLEIERAHV